MGLDREESGLYYNSVFFFQKGGEGFSCYDKRILLPFAEAFPGNWGRSLSRLYGIEDFFVKGEKAVLFDGYIIPSICYEELFSDLMRDGRVLGGKLFVNVTNDGWYPNSSLPEQHFVQGLIRSVENGIPLIRSCNTGVTAAVDSLGRVVARFGEKGEDFQSTFGCLDVRVPKKKQDTLFSFWGNKFILSLCCISIIFNKIVFNKMCFYFRKINVFSKIGLDENLKN